MGRGGCTGRRNAPPTTHSPAPRGARARRAPLARRMWRGLSSLSWCRAGGAGAGGVRSGRGGGRRVWVRALCGVGTGQCLASVVFAGGEGVLVVR